MTKEDANLLIEASQGFLGMEKLVVTHSQLGLPSKMEKCMLDGAELIEVRGEFSPMARLVCIDDRSQVWYEELQATIDYFKRQNV